MEHQICVKCGQPVYAEDAGLCGGCTIEVHGPSAIPELGGPSAPAALAADHRWLCHPDGSDCPDGCDAAPDPERLRQYQLEICECGAALAHVAGDGAQAKLCPRCDVDALEALTEGDAEVTADGGQVVHSESYREHTIQVVRTTRARPFCVVVDGRMLYGSGGRVRRRLNYSTEEAAAAQGRRHIRQLGGGVS